MPQVMVGGIKDMMHFLRHLLVIYIFLHVVIINGTIIYNNHILTRLEG